MLDAGCLILDSGNQMIDAEADFLKLEVVAEKSMGRAPG